MGLMIGRPIRAFGADDVALPGRKFKKPRFQMIADSPWWPALYAPYLEVHDPVMKRLLGIAGEHTSHLNEIGAKDCVGALRLIESMGGSVLHLAVAHSIHEAGETTSAGDTRQQSAAYMRT